MMKKITVLAVDDHPLLREGIAAITNGEEDMELVAQGTSGAEAIELFRAHRPDVTLMDIQMPGMNGIETIAAIRNEFPNARFIVLTTYQGDIQALRALKAGASGYLLKTCCGRTCWRRYGPCIPERGASRRKSQLNLRSMLQTML